MTVCCVVGCTTRSEYRKDSSITLHRFPLHPKTKEKWIKNIFRKNWTPSTYSVVCSLHFEAKCFDRSKKIMKLLPGSIPTIFPSYPSYHRNLAKKRLTHQIQKKLPGGHQSKIFLGEHSYCSSVENQTQDVVMNRDSDISMSLSDVNEIYENGTPHPSWEDFNSLKKKLESTSKKLIAALKAKERLEKAISCLFSDDQIQFIKESSVSLWSDKTIRKALQLRVACGPDGYSMLISQGFPFPSERTLRRRIQDMPLNEDIVLEAMQMLSTKALLEQEKKIAVSLDS